MKLVIITLILIALATISAWSQSQPPPFVPYTITAEQHKQIVDYLMELPAKYANPLLNTLAQYEQAAQAEAKKQSGEDKPKE